MISRLINKRGIIKSIKYNYSKSYRNKHFKKNKIIHIDKEDYTVHPLINKINTIKEDNSKPPNNSQLFIILSEIFKTKKQVKELFKLSPYEQMRYYNDSKQYSKVLIMYKFLTEEEKLNNFIKIEHRFALDKIKEQEKIYYEIVKGDDEMKDFSKYKYIKFKIAIYSIAIICLMILIVYRNEIRKKIIDRFEIKIDESKDIYDNNEEIYKKIIKFIKDKVRNNIPDLTNNFEIKYAEKIKERLDNVKGIEEVKEEIQELINFLKDPESYLTAGAKLPKGVLLCGKPGTGKTLIARAIAGEAGVNFIYLTGSDFDEMFVGVGASRIRKLFDTARKTIPCIIFIDEIDSLIAASRRKGESSSSRATINQFLAEMDGFKKNDNVMVIGATNHENDLDPAAIRPGRFDKKIHINVPDESGRTEIIKFYLNRIKMKKKELDPVYIAKLTPGFTGAEIENLINLAIVRAVNLHKIEVDMDDISESRDRVYMGIANKHLAMSDKKRYHVALHEAGHTLVCYKSLSCRKTLDKVTVIPRGSAAGVTMRLNDEEALNSKQEYMDFIDMCMGGHVAEELVYGSDHVTAGCSSDLDQATNLARQMVKKYGMYGDQVGYLYIEDEGYTWDVDITSDKYKGLIDDKVKNILKESHDKVYEILRKDANELKNIAQKVFQYDTLNYKEIVAAIEGRFDDIKRSKVREEFIDEEEIEV